ncbi:MAG: polysaccharide biosynthesis C-terminal domain-containing protein, partial [Clostridia bacterium]
ILFFPFAFLASLISILIPEISRLNTFKDKTKRDKKIEKILKVTFLFSIVTGGIFYFIPREIGLLFYKSEEATYAMKILAIVTPFMYIETISDGILKGIGEEKFTMRVSIYNSVSRILIILFLLPRYGANGYLWLLVVSNTFSFFMCYFRLKIKSSFTLGFVSHFMMPCIITVVTGIFIRKTLDFLQLPIIISSIGGALVYIMIFSILILPVIKYANRKNI